MAPEKTPLEKWVEYGWLKAESTSSREIADLLSIVSRDLADAEVEAKNWLQTHHPDRLKGPS